MTTSTYLRIQTSVKSAYRTSINDKDDKTNGKSDQTYKDANRLQRDNNVTCTYSNSLIHTSN